MPPDGSRHAGAGGAAVETVVRMATPFVTGTSGRRSPAAVSATAAQPSSKGSLVAVYGRWEGSALGVSKGPGGIGTTLTRLFFPLLVDRLSFPFAALPPSEVRVM